jgi:hypothetical protein
MSIFKASRRTLLFSCWFTLMACSSYAADAFNKLAVGVTYKGGQVHWGFAKKWAVELRAVKAEQASSAGTVTSSAVGLRGIRYFRAPSRLRFYTGLEGASTQSDSSTDNYKTSGFAIGGFAGSEIYLLKRLSVGVDIGPYFLSSEVRRSDTSDGEVYIVINSFMNFYFL